MKIEEQADILLNRCNDANGATYVFNVDDVRAVAQMALCKPAASHGDTAMTRRDWFALGAIVAIWTGKEEITSEADIAWSYRIANAMEKARVQK